MATELTVIDPIKLPTASNPAQLPSLPAWLQQRSDALGSAVQPDSKGNHREMAILPPAMILNSSERVTVERHIAGLAKFLDLERTIVIREQVFNNDQAHGIIIAGLLVKGTGAKLDKVSADALTDDYLDAIEDLPAWAVREALRKWNRAESPRLDKPHDFNWRPAPPTLRRLAHLELVAIKARILQFERLLAAVPLIEFSDEHRENMVKRLQVVIHEAAKPVPTLKQAAE